ncbi:hypothetical protein [Citricoccus sp. GCM10030269]|uniref:hypothetical protein n=1 Tax=Citricoccus sp. GCM10030269 TaxID=3273388 RepID=UPI0036232CC0
MSTNGEMSSGFGDFLGSRSNLAGLAGLVVVFLIVMLLSQSPAAAIVAAIVGYGAGYLLTPNVRKTYPSGIPVDGATQEDMSGRLQEFQSTVRRHHAKLPPAADEDLRIIGRHLEEIIGRWDNVEAAIEQRSALESIVYQYLPNTVDVFLNIPDSAKPAAAPEWTDQLRVLREEVARTRDSVLRHDLEAMRTNGRLLEQKFEDGDLKMFREHGL